MAGIALLCKCSYHLQKVFIATHVCVQQAAHIQPLIVECCSVSPDVVGSLSHLQTQAVVDLQDLALGVKHSTAIHERDCATWLTGLHVKRLYMYIAYWSLYQGTNGPLPHPHYETQCLIVYEAPLYNIHATHAHDLLSVHLLLHCDLYLLPLTKQYSQYKCMYIITFSVSKY